MFPSWRECVNCVCVCVCLSLSLSHCSTVIMAPAGKQYLVSMKHALQNFTGNLTDSCCCTLLVD